MATAKLSFNLSPTELGHIDLLIAQGLYTTRTDVIRAALRHLFELHGDVVKRAVQGSTGTGHFLINRALCERYRDHGERQIIDVVGVLEIADDVTPTLADATIESIQIYGMLNASDEIKQQLADRIHLGPPNRHNTTRLPERTTQPRPKKRQRRS